MGQDPPDPIPDRSLEQALAPAPADRLLQKDISRIQSLPGLITGGAQLKDVTPVLYFANGSAGTYTQPITLGLTVVPLVLGWYVGAIDKTGAVVDNKAAVVGGDQSTPVFSGTAKMSWTKNTLTFTVVSTNTGWPTFVNAYFYYAVYADDLTGLLPTGL